LFCVQVGDKGLTEESADKIGKLVQKRGKPLELLAELNKEDSPFRGNASSEKALDELNQLFAYMNVGKCLNRFVFDLSLARGLDYYTGVIFEAVFVGAVKVYNMLLWSAK
jgi:histidyl-tRNA synthetase